MELVVRLDGWEGVEGSVERIAITEVGRFDLWDPAHEEIAECFRGCWRRSNLVQSLRTEESSELESE